jgi:hypothetical protein
VCATCEGWLRGSVEEGDAAGLAMAHLRGNSSPPC